jgi:hypothetical protein
MDLLRDNKNGTRQGTTQVLIKKVIIFCKTIIFSEQNWYQKQPKGRYSSEKPVEKLN